MYDEYEEPCRRPRRRHLSLRLGTIAAAVLALAALRFGSGWKPPKASGEAGTQSVSIVDWRAVDLAVRRSLEHAYDKAARHAETEVQAWVDELRTRVGEDFLPWWFGYFNQQALMLRAVGYRCMDTPLVEGLAGKQPSMEERLESLVEKAFHARVLQPESAQLRIGKITRRSVEVYLYEVQSELRKIRVEFRVRPQEWDRYLGGLPAMVLTLQANRQVPLVVKGVSAGSGAGALMIGRALGSRVHALVLRRAERGFMEHGAMMGSRAVGRYAGGWIAAGCLVWDLADHHRTVVQNRPVLARSLGTFLDELEEQVLRDPRCGVLGVLGEVQREVMQEVSGETPGP